MKVYNTGLLKNKQRFNIAVLVGIVSAIVFGFILAWLYIAFHNVISYFYSLLYVVAGMGIGHLIRYFGRGVEEKFCILAGICALVAILLSFIFIAALSTGFSFSLIPFYLRYMGASLMPSNIYGIIRLMFIAYAVYMAYYYARIV